MFYKLSILVLSPVCIFFVGCVHLPEGGGSAFIVTSPDYENQLGTQGYQQVLSQSKLNNDPRLNAILQRVGSRLAAHIQVQGFQWEYHLIESKEMNAWCMPGGKIAVYTGILPVMLNEAGMAAVMGHEIAHATLRHSGQRISQEMVMKLGLSVADLSLSNSQHHDTLMGLLGAGATVGVILPYSRGHETEADLLGLKYMAKAGYDPQEAVIFWQRFKSAAGGAPPEFLSTHPGSATRIKDLQAHLAEAQQLYAAATSKLGSGEKL
jgi:predicted Zn-dependent protease